MVSAFELGVVTGFKGIGVDGGDACRVMKEAGVSSGACHNVVAHSGGAEGAEAFIGGRVGCEAEKECGHDQGDVSGQGWRRVGFGALGHQFTKKRTSKAAHERRALRVLLLDIENKPKSLLNIPALSCGQ